HASSDPFAFRDCVDEIGLDIAQRLGLSTRPGYFHGLDFIGSPQAKVEPQIVLREIAAPSPNFVELHDAGGMNGDSRADGGTITLGSNQMKTNTVVGVAGSIDQQRRRLADVEHENANVAVVINVPESGATARFRRDIENA